jgi:uncharacterized protein with PCYCGC motif
MPTSNPLLRRLAFAAAALLLPLMVVGMADRAGSKAASKSKSAGKGCAQCLEKGSVLDPNLFSKGYEPDVKPSYEAARKYPDLIDRLHCFCECQENTREHHKTLLTCFTSMHAAGCGICQHEAIMAAQLKDSGVSDDEIEITVESVHKTDGHRPTFGRGL